MNMNVLAVIVEIYEIIEMRGLSITSISQKQVAFYFAILKKWIKKHCLLKPLKKREQDTR